MIAHVSINASDFAKAKEFLLQALKPLGYTIIKEFPEWSVAGFGADGVADLWLHGGEFKQPGHFAFVAKSKKQVDEFHKAALAAGGRDNGKPEHQEEYHPAYYASFAFDPDGNNLEAVFMDPEKMK